MRRRRENVPSRIQRQAPRVRRMFSTRSPLRPACWAAEENAAAAAAAASHPRRSQRIAKRQPWRSSHISAGPCDVIDAGSTSASIELLGVVSLTTPARRRRCRRCPSARTSAARSRSDRRSPPASPAAAAAAPPRCDRRHGCRGRTSRPARRPCCRRRRGRTAPPSYRCSAAASAGSAASCPRTPDWCYRPAGSPRRCRTRSRRRRASSGSRGSFPSGRLVRRR